MSPSSSLMCVLRLADPIGIEIVRSLPACASEMLSKLLGAGAFKGAIHCCPVVQEIVGSPTSHCRINMKSVIVWSGRMGFLF